MHNICDNCGWEWCSCEERFEDEDEDENLESNFDFECATGIAPAVEVVEWVEDSDPAVPKKIKLHHDGTEFGTFVKGEEEK